MTVQRLTFSMDYKQDEHQRELVVLSNAIDQLQAQVVALQNQVAQLQSFVLVTSYTDARN